MLFVYFGGVWYFILSSFDLYSKPHSASFCRDPNTIFRGNSLTSKCIDETMKLAGMHYLQVTLKPIIDEVQDDTVIFMFCFMLIYLSCS